MCWKEMMAASRQKSDKMLVFLFPFITFALFVAAALLYWVIKTNPWQLW